MSENDFIYFATQGSPNVVAQATYAASTYVGPGRSSGILPSDVYNKIARQGSAGAAIISQFIINSLAVDVLDDGNLANLVAQFELALQQVGGNAPSRIVTASTDFTLLLSDFWVFLNRTVGPAITTINLPNGAVKDQEFGIGDIAGNFNAFNVTVVPPVGSIAGLPRWVLTEDRKATRFKFLGSNIWGVI